MSHHQCDECVVIAVNQMTQFPLSSLLYSNNDVLMIMSLGSLPSWMLLWRWLMMAVRMVDRFITWAHWARPRVNSSFQQARTRLVFASWLKRLETRKKHGWVWKSVEDCWGLRLFTTTLSGCFLCVFPVDWQHQIQICMVLIEQWGGKTGILFTHMTQTTWIGTRLGKRGAYYYHLTLSMSSPESGEGRDGACPVHGEEEESGGWLTDVVYIQILGHGAGHGQLHTEEKTEEEGREKQLTN